MEPTRWTIQSYCFDGSKGYYTIRLQSDRRGSVYFGGDALRKLAEIFSCENSPVVQFKSEQVHRGVFEEQQGVT